MKRITFLSIKVLLITVLLCQMSCALLNVDKEVRGDIIGKIGAFNKFNDVNNVKVYIEGSRESAVTIEKANTFSFKDVKPGKYNVIMEILNYNALYIIKDVDIKKEKMAYVYFPWFTEGPLRFIITPPNTQTSVDTLIAKDGTTKIIVKNEWKWDNKEIGKNDIFKRGNIEGIVKDRENSSPGEFVEVWLINGIETDPKTLIYKDTTDKDSKFIITGVQPGLYELHFSSKTPNGSWNYFNNILIKADSTAISGEVYWIPYQPSYIPEPSNAINGMDWTMSYK